MCLVDSQAYFATVNKTSKYSQPALGLRHRVLEGLVEGEPEPQHGCCLPFLEGASPPRLDSKVQKEKLKNQT